MHITDISWSTITVQEKTYTFFAKLEKLQSQPHYIHFLKRDHTEHPTLLCSMVPVLHPAEGAFSTD